MVAIVTPQLMSQFIIPEEHVRSIAAALTSEIANIPRIVIPQ